MRRDVRGIHPVLLDLPLAVTGRLRYLIRVIWGSTRLSVKLIMVLLVEKDSG